MPKLKKPVPAKSVALKPAPAAADAGERAYLLMKARIEAVPATQVLQPRIDLRQAASFVCSDTLPRLKDAGLRARFTSLPTAEFDAALLEVLGPAAEAVLWTQARLAEVETAATGPRLPVELLTEATALRSGMLEVCAYHFRQDPRLLVQVEDVRSGQGYLDLAEDLSRLSALYRAHDKVLKQDLRFYRAADASDALELSQRITHELRSQGPQALRDTAWRAWTVLHWVYGEVARAGRFLLREAGDAAFPALISVCRAASKRTQKTPAAPPSPPAP